jgi:hypothetical protein
MEVGRHHMLRALDKASRNMENNLPPSRNFFRILLNMAIIGRFEMKYKE